MKNYLLPIFAVVVLGVAAASVVRTQPVLETNPPPSAPPKSDFPERVAAVGLIEANSENISLSAHLPGVVEKVYVTVGQDVAAGAPLFKQDTRALEAARAERASDIAARKASVGSAKARAAKARTALAEVQRTLRFAEAVSDTRSISSEELTRRRSAVETAQAEVQAAEAEIAVSEAAVASADAALKAVETDIARSTVTAPINGRVLQLKLRVGEYAAAGAAAQPWLLLGNVSPLHVRVDIDEHEAWRIRPEAKAVAQVRGNAQLAASVSFVRFEPYVQPKRSLTGDSNERVDTRVLQAIYRIENANLPLYVGQQMDVFIDAAGVKVTMLSKSK